MIDSENIIGAFENIHVPDVYFNADGMGKIKRCDGVNDCLNTDLDERFCQETDCDMICNFDIACLDERVCNGLTYGMFCDADCLEWDEENRCVARHYIRAGDVCDGIKHCSDGADEEICAINKTTPSCLNLQTNFTSRLHNFSRCSPRLKDKGAINIVDFEVIKFCDDFIDQTNCSDSARVGLECLVKGYNTTVAKQIICPDRKRYDAGFYNVPQICDDGLDKACFQISASCNVHKHLLCDNVTHCSDNDDETHEQCRLLMTERKCVRNYLSLNREEVPFPLAWAGDGVMDCVDGSDESKDWPTCGLGRTFRAVLHSDESILCDEVFLCHDQDLGVVTFLNLCDRRESCGNDNEIDVCSVSRMQHRTFSVVVRDHMDNTVMLKHCLRGVSDFSLSLDR